MFLDLTYPFPAYKDIALSSIVLCYSGFSFCVFHWRARANASIAASSVTAGAATSQKTKIECRGTWEEARLGPGEKREGDAFEAGERDAFEAGEGDAGKAGERDASKAGEGDVSEAGRAVLEIREAIEQHNFRYYKSALSLSLTFRHLTSTSQ